MLISYRGGGGGQLRSSEPPLVSEFDRYNDYVETIIVAFTCMVRTTRLNTRHEFLFLSPFAVFKNESQQAQKKMPMLATAGHIKPRKTPHSQESHQCNIEIRSFESQDKTRYLVEYRIESTVVGKTSRSECPIRRSEGSPEKHEESSREIAIQMKGDYPLLCPRARLTVALPRARPTPLPRWPRERNMGAFLITYVSVRRDKMRHTKAL
jgi:hypothetical protein